MLQVGALLRVVLQLGLGGDRQLGAKRAHGVAGGESVGLVLGDREEGVFHAERLEDPLLEEDIQGLATDDLDQPADDVGGNRIVPGLPRRELQRHAGQGGDSFDQPLAVEVLAELQLAVGGINVAELLEAVGQAGGVAQEVDDQHRPVGRLRLEGLHVAAVVDPEVLPFGNVPGHRIVESGQALLDQHHEGDRGDRLGHRVDAEEVVALQLALPFAVGEAQHGLIGQLAAPPDLDLGAGQLARVDVPLLEETLDAAEPFG